MGLDPGFLLMKDGSDGEVGFEVFEGFFDSDEMDVVLPEGSGVAFGEIGAQQIAAFAAADRTQLVAVEGEGEAGRGLSGISCGVGHDRSKGARRCYAAKNLVFLTLSSTSCWLTPTRKRCLTLMGCLMP